MIEFIQGNIFESDCQALVNPVNCVGVSGKGLALAFKLKYPEMYAAYQAACADGAMKIGTVQIWHGSDKIIINFPTKKHWRNPSELKWIIAGLTHLVQTIQELNIKSIAIPALGAGLGGLPYEAVKAEMVKAFEPLPDVKIILYEP